MARLQHLLLLATASILAPMAGAATDIHRVNDLVILDGTTLKFNAFDGLNDTTKDLDWQLDYMESLLTYETQSDTVEGETSLEKRVEQAAVCFNCMVQVLEIWREANTNYNRVYALGCCAPWCASYSVGYIATQASRLGWLLGWDWDNGPQKEVWSNAPKS